MSNGIPAPGDADDQRDREPDLSATDEFAKMREVMPLGASTREHWASPARWSAQ